MSWPHLDLGCDPSRPSPVCPPATCPRRRRHRCRRESCPLRASKPIHSCFTSTEIMKLKHDIKNMRYHFFRSYAVYCVGLVGRHMISLHEAFRASLRAPPAWVTTFSTSRAEMWAQRYRISSVGPGSSSLGSRLAVHSLGFGLRDVVENAIPRGKMMKDVKNRSEKRLLSLYKR